MGKSGDAALPPPLSPNFEWAVLGGLDANLCDSRLFDAFGESVRRDLYPTDLSTRN